MIHSVRARTAGLEMCASNVKRDRRAAVWRIQLAYKLRPVFLVSYRTLARFAQTPLFFTGRRHKLESTLAKTLCYHSSQRGISGDICATSVNQRESTKVTKLTYKKAVDCTSGRFKYAHHHHPRNLPRLPLPFPFGRLPKSISESASWLDSLCPSELPGLSIRHLLHSTSVSAASDPEV